MTWKKRKISGGKVYLAWDFELDRKSIFQSQLPMKCCAVDPSQKLLLVGSNEGLIGKNSLLFKHFRPVESS